MVRLTDSVVVLFAAAVVPVNGDAMTDGWYTSSRAEVLEEEPLVVSGQLPTWLRGDFMKQTASVYEEPKRNLTHVFDGFGKVLRWRFGGGDKVPTLRARMLPSQWWEKSEEAHDVVPSAVFVNPEPPFSEAQKLKGLAENCSDNYNVNFHNFGKWGHRVAITDSKANGMDIDADDLTGKPVSWNDKWEKKLFDRMSPAHPRTILDGTKDTISIVERIEPMAVTGVGEHEIIAYRVNYNTGERTVLQTIKTKRLPYVHSIGLTEHYAIVCASPLWWHIPTLMSGGSANDAFRWSGAIEGALIYLIPVSADGGPVRTYTADAFFAFHHVNAWEEQNGDVVFDVFRNLDITEHTPSPVANFTLPIQRDPELRETYSLGTQLRRYTLPAGGEVASYQVQDAFDANGKRCMGELPAVNPAFRGKHSCFIWFWSLKVGERTASDVGLVRKDTCNPNAPALIWYKKNHFPGEPYMVGPSSGGEAEGVVLSAVHDGDVGSTYLLVLNATTMTTIAELRRHPGKEQRIMAFSIHGQFYPTSD